MGHLCRLPILVMLTTTLLSIAGTWLGSAATSPSPTVDFKDGGVFDSIYPLK